MHGSRKDDRALHQQLWACRRPPRAMTSEAYLSVGYEHHNIILKKTDQKSLLSLGYQLKPNIEIANLPEGPS